MKHFNITLRIFFIAFAVSNNFSSVSFAGGNTGGGTLAIRIESEKPILLDLMENDPQFQDAYDISGRDAGMIRETQDQKQIAISHLQIFSLVQKRLAIWEENSPFTIGLIKSALARMHWKFTSQNVPIIPQYHVSQSLLNLFPGLKIVGAISYTTEFGAIASTEVWNSTGDYSQAGLIVHEGLRHVQLRYLAYFTNEVLQKMTALIMLREPTIAKQLDSPTDYNNDLKNLLVEKRDFNNALPNQIAKICTLLQPLNLKSSSNLAQTCGEIPTFNILEKLQSLLSEYMDSNEYSQTSGKSEELDSQHWKLRNDTVFLLLKKYSASMQESNPRFPY